MDTLIDPGTAAMQHLLGYNEELTGLRNKDWTALYPSLTERHIRKGDHLLTEGKPCTALLFIHKGYCRAYTDKDGKDINRDFFFENDIATDINSFTKGGPSGLALQACEALTVICFDKDKLMAAAGQDPDISELGRKCLQRIAARQELHTALYQLLNPEERYAHLEAHQPALLQRVSLSQLASYLGVARETLSRIRARRS